MTQPTSGEPQVALERGSDDTREVARASYLDYLTLRGAAPSLTSN